MILILLGFYDENPGDPSSVLMRSFDLRRFPRSGSRSSSLRPDPDRSSLNFFYGATMVRTKLVIGNEILSRIGGSIPAGQDLISLTSLGPVVGIGNRWKFGRGFSFSIDWITLTQPVVVLKNDTPIFDRVTDPNDKNNLDDFKRVMNYFPRFTFLKLELGFSF